MTIDFLLLIMVGNIKDPILWILASIIGSNVLAKSISKKIIYLLLSGLILGLIRLNIYKSFGENFTTTQTVLLIFITVLAEPFKQLFSRHFNINRVLKTTYPIAL